MKQGLPAAGGTAQIRSVFMPAQGIQARSVLPLSGLSGQRSLIGLNLVLLLVASQVATVTFQLYTNTLSRHPEWQSTKSTLKRGVTGAIAYTVTAPALGRNRLNLGAWHGFQEVTYREPLRLAAMEASVRFEPEGYVNVLYGIDSTGFSGIRLSDRADLPAIQFRATAAGAFVTADTLDVSVRAAPDAWHLVELRFTPSGTTIGVNGREAGRFSAVSGLQRVGFRGGQRNAWVDDVVLRLSDGAAIRKTFTNSRRALAVFVVTFAGLLVLAAIASLVAVGRAVPFRTSGLATAMGTFVLIGALALAYLYQFVRPRTYPMARGTTAAAEAYWSNAQQGDVLAALTQSYGAPPGPETYRILFLGTSQTWGAGAAGDGGVWVRQLETLLSLLSNDRRVECLNAGVSGLTAAGTLAFQRQLMQFGPHAAVITLSNNDTDTASFRLSLDSMVGSLTHAGVRPVLILEPNSRERRVTDSYHGDLAIKHDVMRAVGARHDVPVIDMHQHLLERNGTGFLWWDFVHLTDYGQSVVAQKLSEELPLLLAWNRPDDGCGLCKAAEPMPRLSGIPHRTMK